MEAKEKKQREEEKARKERERILQQKRKESEKRRSALKRANRARRRRDLKNILVDESTDDNEVDNSVSSDEPCMFILSYYCNINILI